MGLKCNVNKEINKGNRFPGIADSTSDFSLREADHTIFTRCSVCRAQIDRCTPVARVDYLFILFLRGEHSIFTQHELMTISSYMHRPCTYDSGGEFNTRPGANSNHTDKPVPWWVEGGWMFERSHQL